MSQSSIVELQWLQAALEASWDAQTAYLGVAACGNPALGQCYPTARVVQEFLPESEIVDGEVWTGDRIEHHFWSVIDVNGTPQHIDFTWPQFPRGSSVRSFTVRNRHTLNDSAATTQRVDLLRMRVRDYLRRAAPARL